jgi:NAD(P)-dependent dehydrogenase (short-subunit alcohol dehydrogenase family)
MNKIALITGASRGIGRAIALRFAREGALVGVHYGRNREAAEATLGEIEGLGGSGFVVRTELGTRASVDVLLQRVDAELDKRTGSNRFDILVNNAAIAPHGTLEDTSEELFDGLFALNVKIPFFLTQQALPRLRDGGRVINLSSGISHKAVPERLPYAMTKGAIDVFNRTVARALAPRGITVNALAPGFIETDMNAELFRDPKAREAAAKVSAFKRIGTPEDLVGVAAFLASDDAHWVTGHYMDATGGSLL